MSNGVLQRIQDWHALPSLPAIAAEVLDAVRPETADAGQLARVIARDPALSAKLLRTVNSSFVGYNHSISSLTSAIAIVGIPSVKTLMLGFSLVPGLPARKRSGFDYSAYWRRSLYAATAAQGLARRVEPAQQETCRLAALLMDIGMLALDQVVGAPYGEICAQACAHTELAQLETRVLGLSHQDVAYHLAELWQLPDMLALPMACHHCPEQVKNPAVRPLAELVGWASRCADVLTDRTPVQSPADIARECMQRHGIGQLDCDSMLVEVRLRAKDLDSLLAMPPDGEAGYHGLLQKANDQLLRMTHIDNTPLERRRASRVPRKSNVTISTCRQGVVGSSVAVQLRDVSARGIGLLHQAPMEMGSQFILPVSHGPGPAHKLLYRVVHCRHVPGEGYTIGAELECMLREDAAAPEPQPA